MTKRKKMDNTATGRIKAVIKDRKLKQQHIADKMGLVQQQVSYQLQKGDDVTIEFVRKMCKVIDEPYYKVVLSDEEIKSISVVKPELMDILNKLSKCSPEQLKKLSAIIDIIDS
jgi:transcriptional regulator with XRE-family HTH domain